jgi:hypothetical protein
MPWPEGRAILLTAYLDASARPDSGVLSVAAVAFGADRAKKATRRWVNLWGDKRCHMTELHTRPMESYGLTSEQAGDRLKACVPIINDTASFISMVSVDVAELQRLMPRGLSKNSEVLWGAYCNPYGFCCHLAMGALARLTTGDGGIAYFIEKGDEGQSEWNAFQRWFVSHPGVTIYKHRSVTVMSKADCRLFEVCDIAAWEWAKHIERNGEGKRMRPSLRALLGEGLQMVVDTNVLSSNRRGWHVTGEKLEQYFKESEKLGFFAA